MDVDPYVRAVALAFAPSFGLGGLLTRAVVIKGLVEKSNFINYGEDFTPQYLRSDKLAGGGLKTYVWLDLPI